MLAELRELSLTRRNPNDFYVKRPLVKDFADALFSPLKMKPTSPLFYPVVTNRKYALHAISPITYMMKFVRPETKAIVELGSGWSCNLFQFYVGLGRTRCRTIEFHGAEYTDAGQRAADAIAKF